MPSRAFLPKLWSCSVQAGQAAYWRPERNSDTSGTAAAIADGVIGPMAGMVASLRRLVSPPGASLCLKPVSFAC